MLCPVCRLPCFTSNHLSQASVPSDAHPAPAMGPLLQQLAGCRLCCHPSLQAMFSIMFIMILFMSSMQSRSSSTIILQHQGRHVKHAPKHGSQGSRDWTQHTASYMVSSETSVKLICVAGHLCSAQPVGLRKRCSTWRAAFMGIPVFGGCAGQHQNSEEQGSLDGPHLQPEWALSGMHHAARCWCGSNMSISGPALHG
jgi:hypothetical protein